MAYTYWLSAIFTNKQVCDTLASAFDPNSGGGETWNYATKLYPAGTTFQPAPDQWSEPIPSQASTARLVSVPSTDRGYTLATEFLSAGPYPNLNAIGLTDQMISAAKPYVTAEVGDRATYESHVAQFVSSSGYVVP